MIPIAHKIELVPNNKQKTYFRKAFGCARLAYNWGLAEWQRRYKAGEKCSWVDLQKSYNSIRKIEYPFTLEVTKFASTEPFRNLGKSFSKFFNDLKKGTVSYPRFKKKKDSQGSFYVAGEKIHLSSNEHKTKVFNTIPVHNFRKKEYLYIPKLGWVRMTQKLRFHGKINGVHISQEGDKFFASFDMFVTKDEFRHTHPQTKDTYKEKAVGIDLGVKYALTLSDGIFIENYKPIKKSLRKIKKLGRQLSKRSYARTKQERLNGKKKSNNYRKLSVKLANAHRRVANIRRDYTHKITTILTTHYGKIALENLNVKGMARNHRIAQSISDVAFGELCRQIEYKAINNDVTIKKADRFYPSSKVCSVCGNVKHDLKLSARIYHCDKCGVLIDRDYNASLNLLSLITEKQIGADYPESTPEDLTALLSRFERNKIATSKVETGRQRKL